MGSTACEGAVGHVWLDPTSRSIPIGSATSRSPGRLAAPLESLVAGRPRTVLALKAAVAAGLAWLVVIPFSGVADDYPYYAPLGAVVVTSTTVMTSVRTSLQALASLAIGAGLAVLVVQVPVPRVFGVMAVVGIGTALATWKRLGEMSSWVPFTALFVLILGGEDPSDYVLGYGGLTAVGAAVGVAVNLAFPQLPLGRTLQALAELQEELARQLRSLAEDLRTEDDLGTDSAQISDSVAPPAQRLGGLVAEVRDARRANWRAGRWGALADRRVERAEALGTITYLVEELGALLGRSSRQLLRGRSALGDAIADALDSTAHMLEATDLMTMDDDAHASVAEARRCVEQLREVTLRQTGDRDADDAVLVGASATVALQRAIESWE